MFIFKLIIFFYTSQFCQDYKRREARRDLVDPISKFQYKSQDRREADKEFNE